MALISASVAALTAIGTAATASAISAPLLGAGLVASAVGAGGQMYYTRQASAASRRAERARQEQMRLESMRRQREIIRQSQVANATSLARTVNQGSGVFSSALAGAYGQTQGALGRASNTEYQNLGIGERIFQANMDQSVAQGWASTFNGIGQFGQQMMNTAKGVGQMFATGPQPQAVATNYPTFDRYGFYGGLA